MKVQLKEINKPTEVALGDVVVTTDGDMFMVIKVSEYRDEWGLLDLTFNVVKEENLSIYALVNGPLLQGRIARVIPANRLTLKESGSGRRSRDMEDEDD